MRVELNRTYNARGPWCQIPIIGGVNFCQNMPSVDARGAGIFCRPLSRACVGYGTICAFFLTGR